MSITRIVIAMLLLAIVAVPVVAFAQNEMPKYNPKTEVTIKGTVTEVKEIAGAKGKTDIHLMVKFGENIVEVCLCPIAFLNEFGVAFHKGDQLIIVGSKGKMGDQDVVLAREIEQGDNKIVMRDKEGAPVWTWLTK